MKKIILFLYLICVSSWILAGEKDLYDFLWLDPDKSVYVLQNKIYPKNKSFYFDVGYLSGLSSEFQDTRGVQIKAGHYFKEEWALEFNYSNYSYQNNATYESLKAINGAEPFIRRVNNLTSAFVVWSPFYGKINTFNQIYYFDWSFGVGTGFMHSESNLESVTRPQLPNKFKSEIYNPLLFKTNVKFHLNRNVHIGIEFHNANFQAGTPKAPAQKDWRQSNDLIFSLGVSF